VSSWGHHLSDIRWDDPHFERDYDGMVAYGQSKTANVLFAVELDRRWSGDGIRGYDLHPGGIVETNLGPWLTIDDKKAMGLLDDAGKPINAPERDLKTPAQGASTQVWAATNPLLADIGGRSTSRTTTSHPSTSAKSTSIPTSRPVRWTPAEASRPTRSTQGRLVVCGT
jgi:NAD(P)-dependent dehydrogenase (short-subunit alcohol dehydrogenase family)